jgi:hypothetical protein
MARGDVAEAVSTTGCSGLELASNPRFGRHELLAHHSARTTRMPVFDVDDSELTAYRQGSFFLLART